MYPTVCIICVCLYAYLVRRRRRRREIPWEAKQRVNGDYTRVRNIMILDIIIRRCEGQCVLLR